MRLEWVRRAQRLLEKEKQVSHPQPVEKTCSQTEILTFMTFTLFCGLNVWFESIMTHTVQMATLGFPSGFEGE